jgi:hypothetical protein
MTTPRKPLWLCLDCLFVVPQTAAMLGQLERWLAFAGATQPPWPSLLRCPTCETGKLVQTEDDHMVALAAALLGVGGAAERLALARVVAPGYLVERP